MENFSRKTLILLIIFLLSVTYSKGEKCACPAPPIDLNKNLNSEFVSTEDDITIQGTNWGKQMKVGNTIFLQKSSKTRASNSALNHGCPTGYMGPTEAQLNSAITQTKMPKLLELGFFEVGKVYATTDKPNPDPWTYQSLVITADVEGGAAIYAMEAQSSQTSDSIMFTKCVLDVDEFTKNASISDYINYHGNSDQDLTSCQKYDFSIKNEANVLSQKWISGSNTETSSEYKLTAVSKEEDCGYLIIEVTVFGGVRLQFCHRYYVKGYTNRGASEEKLNSESDIQKIVHSDKLSDKQNNIHLNPGQAPLAPKRSGGAYILHSEKDTKKLTVLEIDNDGKIVKSYPLNCKGKPFDIVETPYGFVFMARDEPEHLYVKAWDVKENKEKWNNNIIKNGSEPTTATEQFDFEGGFGTQAMYNPHNGRLVYARNTIFLIFARYNHFGMMEGGRRNDHTGDSSCFLDAETGSKRGIGFPWGVSHSMIQSAVYDGSNIISAALGDAYPQSIRNYQFNNFEKQGASIAKKETHLIEPDLIPGDGGGEVCGRLGQLSVLEDNLISQVHSQWPCTQQFAGSARSEENKLSILFFDKSFNPPLSAHTLKPGLKVKNIKSAKYGDNILVGYTLQKNVSGQWLQGHITSDDQMKILLVNKQGKVLKDIEISSSTLSAPDDWEVLQDGSVMWTWINDENQIELYKLPALNDDPKAAELIQNCKALELKEKENKPTSSGPGSTSGSHILEIGVYLIFLTLLPIYFLLF